MSKNIVVFSDGTGQEGGEGNNTNVYKIYQMLENRTPRQISFYDRGLGTGWRKFSGNAFGAGISKNIRDCYKFIFEHYEAGDQIFLFGFSRGAATVRSLSGFIHLFGMLPKSRPELIDDAWKIYKKSDLTTRKDKADELVAKNHTMWVTVKFIGVFDTVAALGVPNKRLSRWINKAPWMRHKFHDFKLSGSVENAYQALAIDDQRKTFHPVIWDPELKEDQQMEQVWFAGVHTDVGGGYEKKGLADVSLKWMKEKAELSGLKIYDRHTVIITPDADGEMHDPFDSKVPWKRKERSWDSSAYGNRKPKVHGSVVQRSLDSQNTPDSKYDPWILKIPHEVV